MFKTLFNEYIDHKLIVIEDSAKCNADEVIIAGLAQAVTTQPHNVLLLCTEKSILTYTSKLSIPISSYCVPSLFAASNLQNSNIFDKLSLKSIIKEITQKYIFIDSINPFIWDCGILKFIKDLKNLFELGFHFTVRIHSDALFEDSHLESVLYYSTAHLKVVENFGFNKFIIQTIFKKMDKKLFGKKEVERILIGDDYTIQIVAEDLKFEKPQHTSVSINSLTTFNLGTNMSLTEKQARDQLILPYLRTSENDGSLITYEADDADLEEDPDEDLEL